MASRADQLRNSVAAAAGDPKKLWSTARRLLHIESPTVIQDEDCKKMVSAFSNFFTDKIAGILDSIQKSLQLSVDAVSAVVNQRMFTGSALSAFNAVTTNDVIKLINHMPNKSSPLDILPTSLLKSCCDIFAPAITHLVNQSFASGKFPAAFKVAQVTPLLKKQGLDKSQPSSY
jgi:hypothetical protein